MYRPPATYLWSVIWFLQEMVIFADRGRVFWKRPATTRPRAFFWLCVLTVGAYMGGYHWTEIVVEPVLIYLFAAFAVFVPVVSLHFYLVFPRTNPVLGAHRGLVLAALYGVPAAYLAGALGVMLWSRWLAELGRRARVAAAFGWSGTWLWVTSRWRSCIFGLCVALPGGQLPPARTRSERNQVQWILLASLISSL